MLRIKNATISAGEGNRTKKVDILIDEGKIAEVLSVQQGPQGEEEIDASGLLVVPGAIDPHVHFDTPGFEHREDFAHGSRAAAAGGVTTVIDMPCTSVPPVISLAGLENKLRVIEPQAFVDFALWGGVSQNLIKDGDWFKSMDELWNAGVVGFKTYMISGMDSFRALTYMELGQVMQNAKKMGALIGIHAEDARLINERMEMLKKMNRNSPDDYYSSRAEPVEKDGVALAIGLANQTKTGLHIVHIASGAAARMVWDWKSLGLDLSCETCPHYLAFTHNDFAKYGSLIKTAPVIKEKEDLECLWKLLSDGGIDFLATDHAPCQLAEKRTGSAWTDHGGIPGIELMLSFAFSEGYSKKRLTLARLVEITSTNAAKRFGLYPRKGAIEKGSDADLVLIDPKRRWKVSGDKMHSRAKWTPFDGFSFTGKVVRTILRGDTIFTETGDVSDRPTGKWVRRNAG